MRIITAAATGMCFGVRDALLALEAIEQPQKVAIYGELVHNDVVLHQLDLRGFQQLSEADRPGVPTASTIVITAHGISDRRRSELVAAGKTLIDTTCPLVARAHRAAQELARAGALVIVIGRANHVEIQGITGDLDSFEVVSSVDQVHPYLKDRIGIMCQTTFPCEEARAIRQRIADCNPKADIHWIDTICQPTKDRQLALNDLLEQVEAVIVVGGKHSHNTRRLVETCQQRGLAAFHIQDAEELRYEWLDDFESVGLTAGTSTLPETLDRVLDRMREISRQREIAAGALSSS